jgi:protein TonB
MPTLIRVLCFLLLALVSLSAFAQGDLPRTVDVSAALSVSPEGRIEKLEFVERISAELETFLRDRVKTWSIKPARRGGSAVGGETTLYLRLSVEPAGDDVLVTVARASTGPRYAQIDPPSYPQTALQARRQAVVLVTAEVRADGTVGAMDSRMVAGKAMEKTFVGAAERSIRAWRFVPERVDGVAVATRVRIPVVFQIPGATPLAMPALEDDVALEPNALIAESEFEVASDVVGRAL